MSRPTIVRKLSLEEHRSLKKPTRSRTIVRKQKSADENPLLHPNDHLSNRSAKSKNDKSWSSERPKIRIAWTSSSPKNENDVDLMASQIIGIQSIPKKPNTSTGASSATMSSRCLMLEPDKATILYSREELAERLRIAWKQREANKSNIDIFLAHDTIGDEASRCNSRLSSSENFGSIRQNTENGDKGRDIKIGSTVNDRDTNKNYENIDDPCFNTSPSPELPNSGQVKDDEDGENDVKKMKATTFDAKAKRASFQAGTNFAFTGHPAINKAIVSPILNKGLSKRRDKNGDHPDKLLASSIYDNRIKRTISAPPIQRRPESIAINPEKGSLNSASLTRPKVNIVIDTPKMTSINKDGKSEKKEASKPKQFGSTSMVEEMVLENNNFTSFSSLCSTSSSSLNEKPAKTSFSRKKSSKKDAKRKMEVTEKKNECKANLDVVTMVSLVSDAESDSEVEKNLSSNNKLVRQLRNNLPITPIIKNRLTVDVKSNVDRVERTFSNDTENCLRVPPRIFKSVSFEQDALKKYDNESTQEQKKIPYTDLDYPKQTSQQQFTPTYPMIEKNRKPLENDGNYVTDNSVPLIRSVSASPNYWCDMNDESVVLTDREKRCLIVPIVQEDDQRDKKRKMPLKGIHREDNHQITSSNCFHSSIDQQQNEPEMPPISQSQKQVENMVSFVNHVEESVSITALQSSDSKSVNPDNFNKGFPENCVDCPENENHLIDLHHLRTTKEKECWHLYRKMCDKGVCVSFDTVLRGMLTPTEYRLRRRKFTY